MRRTPAASFSALQRAEIAEIQIAVGALRQIGAGFSALQRAEIAEIECNTVVAQPF